MHILLIHQVFITPSQGGGTRHYELAKYLIELGHKITVIVSDSDYFTSKKKVDDPIPEGMTLLYLSVYNRHNKSILNRALAFFHFSIKCFFTALRVKNVDVIWSTSPPLFQSITALAAAKLRRKPFVFEVRDLWIDFAKQLGVVKNPIIIGLFKRIEALLYKLSDQVIVNSPGFIPYIQPIIPNKPISLFANGVITDEFDNPDPTQIEAYKKTWKLGDDFLVLYAGNLGKANDIECILAAAETLKDKEPSIKFMLLGGGMAAKSFEDTCKKRQLTNVKIVPSIPKKDMPNVLPLASVCIASLKDIPLFATVYPNKVFDYMAAKKPTILSINGVIKEVIENSNGGTTIPPGDANALVASIQHYYQNQDQIKLEGENAYNYVKTHFDRKKIATELSQFFERLT